MKSSLRKDNRKKGAYRISDVVIEENGIEHRLKRSEKE